MSNLKLIEMLCELVEEQGRLIRYLATELEHQRNLTEAETQMVSGASLKYAMIIGADEVPFEI